jgi:CheY-like chemotaxis protein
VKGGNRSGARKEAKLLVVEDDVMIRMVLADMLCELGYTVAAEAASIDEALEATRKTDFDLAILDADLKGRFCLAVADAPRRPPHSATSWFR